MHRIAPARVIIGCPFDRPSGKFDQVGAQLALSPGASPSHRRKSMSKGGGTRRPVACTNRGTHPPIHRHQLEAREVSAFDSIAAREFDVQAIAHSTTLFRAQGHARDI
jgi:hypothetical protein